MWLDYRKAGLALSGIRLTNAVRVAERLNERQVATIILVTLALAGRAQAFKEWLGL